MKAKRFGIRALCAALALLLTFGAAAEVVERNSGAPAALEAVGAAPAQDPQTNPQSPPPDIPARRYSGT